MKSARVMGHKSPVESWVIKLGRVIESWVIKSGRVIELWVIKSGRVMGS